MKELFHKYKEVISYLVFGVATTVVNIVVFFICKDLFGIDYKISNTIGWFLSVLFAFFTNKYFVFASQHVDLRAFFKEMLLFYWYRILSFVIDMALMVLMIEWLHISDFWAKMVTQVVVIVLNYFFSKFLIFKNKAS
ncbi:GtrA family protein [Enterococcus sp. DIV0242_7C1]|uniref:Teichoic acid glycosylation protein n=1 Tax=Candidatus Enterococcus dunnyi TaxID=1834192 RepID=A0A200JED7_9ENTE|nr:MULTISPECIES: GtrA family protein [unclassified Enterococcus]MBO0469621.1 GtrA family protein [Enterococcus sp. DIV0242_7C1]MCA5011849.1 GtrA family protein [Enterococcus sp. S23]MCA5014709.1 GtrA family protein [Enterococcus sp. S22(2020)]OUZ35090.1 teichoic acid glycosylation protein [Enterococcus sp. 9D6_DIV0238]